MLGIRRQKLTFWKQSMACGTLPRLAEWMALPFLRLAWGVFPLQKRHVALYPFHRPWLLLNLFANSWKSHHNSRGKLPFPWHCRCTFQLCSYSHGTQDQSLLLYHALPNNTGGFHCVHSASFAEDHCGLRDQVWAPTGLRATWEQLKSSNEAFLFYWSIKRHLPKSRK